MPDGRENPSGSGSLYEIMRRETESLRTDVENLERMCASLLEKHRDNDYEIRRGKDILEDVKISLNKMEEAVKDLATSQRQLADSHSDLPLIRKIVYGSVGMVLAAFMLYLLAKSGSGTGFLK
jgi:uncharacterized protein YoxC